MTEEEWRAATDPTEMVEYLRGKASDRKLRLFAVACCRRTCADQSMVATITAIETNESFADGQATDAELSRARSAAHNAAWQASFRYQQIEIAGFPNVFNTTRAERDDVPEEVARRLYFVAFMANTPERLNADKMPMLRSDPLLAQLSPNLIRDIFGNPFRPVVANPAWLTPTVVSIASAIYAERAFDRLPILADALEEAGCADADLLLHGRQPGEHVRGCWAVDLVLGKV